MKFGSSHVINSYPTNIIPIPIPIPIPIHNTYTNSGMTHAKQKGRISLKGRLGKKMINEGG